jgi:uncharacterized protein YndB with AHSA1/START domain
VIDGDAQIAAVTRQVSPAGAETRTVTLTQTYASGIDDVWDACTNAERIPRWFLPVTGDLRLGGRYQLEGNAGGTIEACEPPTRFRATWEMGDAVSWIEVRFTAEGPDRTRLELAHSAPVDPHWDQFGPGAVGIGWDLGLVGLSLHLATGQPVDPAAVDEWTRSADGLRFMTESSDSWRDADIASGTPVDDATAKADRTLGAYTGAGEAGSDAPPAA